MKSEAELKAVTQFVAEYATRLMGSGVHTSRVVRNTKRLGEALGVDETRMTLTKQIHDTQVSVVTEDKVGMGLHRPMEWQSDAIVTALADTPIIGFYADCVVTLLYDPATHTAGVCHSGWRGMAVSCRKPSM